MPTPSETIWPSLIREAPVASRGLITTCPDELLPIAYGVEVWPQPEADDQPSTNTTTMHEQLQHETAQADDTQTAKFGSLESSEQLYEPQSPATLIANKQSLLSQKMANSVSSTPRTISGMSASSYSSISSLAYEYSAIRLMPSITPTFLRPGSKFVGNQQSDKMTYDVTVEIKYVDMRESFLCGHLCIKNLTPENPELTTYFEGEMIGPKYSFLTRKKEWGATEKEDIAHWNRFPAYKSYAKSAKRHNYHHYRNFEQEDYIFMRWKECFLVPEHNVKELAGASFEGFYYICFRQSTGTVVGYYFHVNSEKWQQLDLEHVPGYVESASVEFR